MGNLYAAHENLNSSKIKTELLLITSSKHQAAICPMTRSPNSNGIFLKCVRPWGSQRVAKLSAFINRHSRSSSNMSSTDKIRDSSTTPNETGRCLYHANFKNDFSKFIVIISRCSVQENSPSNL